MFGSLFQSRSPNQDRIPKGQRLTNGFPIMTYGDTPQIQRQDWQFRVWGLATEKIFSWDDFMSCLLYTSPSPRDGLLSRMPSSA